MRRNFVLTSLISSLPATFKLRARVIDQLGSPVTGLTGFKARQWTWVNTTTTGLTATLRHRASAFRRDVVTTSDTGGMARKGSVCPLGETPSMRL